MVFLGVPADFDGLLAPVDALLAGSDRLAADFDPDWVRVDARQDAHGDPTGLLDWEVEAQRLSLAVGSDVLRGGDLAVDDDLDRDISRFAGSAAFDVPVVNQKTDTAGSGSVQSGESCNVRST